MKRFPFHPAAFLCFTWLVCLPETQCAGAGVPLVLLSQAEVDGGPVFLSQLVSPPDDGSIPVLRVADAPLFGRSLSLSRAQVLEAVRQVVGGTEFTNVTGALQVRVMRRSRALEETELAKLLAGALQTEHVKERGELELRLSRPWVTVRVPDEPLSLRVTELPALGVTPSFVVRFELRSQHELVGAWQAAVTAKVLREMWVAAHPLRRGDSLRGADLVRERRDVLGFREAPAELSAPDEQVELVENIPAGGPLYVHSLRSKPVVRRGQNAEALVRDGALTVSLRVEVLEDGIPGQFIRVRNPQTHRELRGKVQNEQTILVSL